jgi:hypothetical protein
VAAWHSASCRQIPDNVKKNKPSKGLSEKRPALQVAGLMALQDMVQLTLRPKS